MKRCPQCGREYDTSMMFCLDDGAELLYGPKSEPPALAGGFMSEPPALAGEFPPHDDEPQTAILSEPGAVATGFHHGESPTSKFDQSPSGFNDQKSEKRPFQASRRNSIIAGILGVVLITALGVGSYFYYGRGTTKLIESIAVMPFVNDSGSADAEYLSDGMTETLISSLSKLPNLNVKARSSVFRYKGGQIDLQKVARELNVQAILTGRIVQRGDNLTVSLELVDTQTENALWSEKYNRKIADVFAIQEEIAREISEQLSMKLSGADSQQMAKRPTENLKAFQYYMQGRSNADRRTRDDLHAAIRFYEKAIEEDRNYALAHAGLAEAYAQLGIRGYILASEGRQRSEEAARVALDLDETLAEAHVAKGLLHIVLPPHNLPLGDDEMRRAIELSPSLAIAHFYFGVSLVRQGRLDEAMEKNLKARELDPLSPIIARQVTIHYFFKRDYARALEYLRQANELGPPFSVSWEVGVYVQNGLFEDVLAALEKAKREREGDPILIYSTGAIYAAQGKRKEALEIVKQLDEMSGANLQQAHVIAKIHSALGEKDLTLSWLERGLAAGAIGAFYKDEPVWDTIRHDPRFADLLRRMGIPE